MRVHLLHIGKTGGNAVQHALRQAPAGAHSFVFHPHAGRLPDVPRGERAIFMLRDPVDRFVSGFNSRRRRGRPLRNAAWDAAETAAFTTFAAANDLALALSASDAARRAAAGAAMRGIAHVRTSYADWLVSPAYLEERRADILWIGLTGRLAADFERLRRLLDLPAACRLPSDPVAAHRRLDSDDTRLDAEAAANIRAWYAADYAYLAFAARADDGVGSDGAPTGRAGSTARA
jgi:hypothetical protein